VLKEVVGGGYVRPDIAFTQQLPEVAVYGDGRIFTKTVDVGPEAASVWLMVRRVPSAAVSRVVRLAQAAGVSDHPPDWGQGGVTDADTTSITVVTSGHATTVSVYALGEDHGLSRAQVTARRHLEGFLHELQRLGRGLGPGSPARVYESSSLSVLAVTLDPRSDFATASIRWPIAELRPVSRDWSKCVAVNGAADVSRVLRLAENAGGSPVWLSAGHQWWLFFRPDLPGARPCVKEPEPPAW
jgi:hypothetical protein